MEIIPYIVAGALVMAYVIAWVGSIAWAVKDAQKRGRGRGMVVALFCLFGPFAAAFVWLFARPGTRLDQRTPEHYNDADDTMIAASRLDAQGEWDAAIALYKSVRERWPEHEAYVQKCLHLIGEKQA
jgi:hypothetical protein